MRWPSARGAMSSSTFHWIPSVAETLDVYCALFGK